MPREENNDSHQTFKSPNPQERVLLVTVEESVFTNNPDVLPPEGTLYKNFDRDIFAQDYRRNFEEYLYTGQLDNVGTKAVLAFGKSKTEAEKRIPYRRTWVKHGNHRWPPILKSLILLQDNAFQRSSSFVSNGQEGLAVGPSYYDRYVYIPEAVEGSRFLLEEFFSASPLRIGSYRVPLPTSVQYNVPGLSGSFPESLHDDIQIDAARTSSATFLGGAEYSGSGSVEGQFFPRTNFKGWVPYVMSFEQDPVAGGYYGRRVRVYPPIRPKAIRR